MSCPCILQSGPKTGQKCGVRLKGNAITCGRHKKQCILSPRVRQLSMRPSPPPRSRQQTPPSPPPPRPRHHPPPPRPRHQPPPHSRRQPLPPQFTKRAFQKCLV